MLHHPIRLVRLCKPFTATSRNGISTCKLLLSKKLTQDDFVKKTELKRVRDTELASKELFEDVKKKNKQTFKGALEIFKNRDQRRRGSVEFIRAALKHMKTFGVEKDLEVYKSLIDVMPKGVYIPETFIQASFGHYPR